MTNAEKRLIDAVLSLDNCIAEFTDDWSCCSEYFNPVWDACAALKRERDGALSVEDIKQVLSTFPTKTGEALEKPT